MKKNVSQRAIEAGGGQSAVASIFNVTPTAVRLWGSKNKIPAQHVAEICRMTGCIFQPNDLRPDVFDETQTIGK